MRTKLYFKEAKSELAPVFNKLRKTKTFREIADEYDLTQERVRQICTGVKMIDWEKTIKEGYAKDVKNFSEGRLLREADKLSMCSREKEYVLKRQVIIRLLRDKYHYPFQKIGKAMNRDHTSIINLYYKK